MTPNYNSKRLNLIVIISRVNKSITFHSLLYYNEELSQCILKEPK